MSKGNRKCAICVILKRPDAYHPANEPCSVFSRRPDHQELVGLTEPGGKSKSIKCFAKWINSASGAIDIALFFVLHKVIIKAIIKQQKKGVMVRILMYDHIMMVSGSKAPKYERYTAMLKKAGVEILWINKQSASPRRLFRLLMIDCVTTRTTQGDIHGCFIYGCQNPFIHCFDISRDMMDLMLTQYPATNARVTGMEFEKMWRMVEQENAAAEIGSLIKQTRNFSVAGPSRMLATFH